MILNPSSWPRWPYLPLQNKNFDFGSDLRCGVLVDTGGKDGDQKIVYYVNIFDLPKCPSEWEAANQKVYQNADVLIKAGWIVD